MVPSRLGSTPRAGRSWSTSAGRWGASLLIAVGFGWLLARGGLPLLPDRAGLRRFPTSATVAFCSLLVLASLLRAYRWVFLLRPIAPKLRAPRVIGVGLVGFAAIFLLPLRMGEIVRPLLLSKDKDVSFIQATGTTFAERVIDGVVLTLCAASAFGIANRISPLPSSLGDLPLPLAAVPAAVYSATFMFCGLFIAMTAFYVSRELARRTLKRALSWISPRAADWSAAALERLADGLRFLPSSANLISYLCVTGAYWGLTFAAYGLLLRGAGFEATSAQAVAVVGVLGLGVVVPAGPGLFGAFQMAFFSALALFFPIEHVKSQGAVLVFVAYVTNLVVVGVQLLAGFSLVAWTGTKEIATS